ncbi:uncharacterized protein LOC114256638 [Camellia sinensis]|uniref:uncharacterized protein LOC114256638 n=1 Tax=Camellia sinensis TaxID=4442 RepID=UPI001035DA22|nr:uncharacterized protein LOC114256638 [Camellia sinensis]
MENAHSPSDYISPMGQNRPDVMFPAEGELCAIQGDSPGRGTDDLTVMAEDLAKFQFYSGQDLEDSAVNWFDYEESLDQENFEDSERIRKAKAHVRIETAASTEMENATRNATGLVAATIATGLGALTHTLGTFIPVIGASGFATAPAATVIETVIGLLMDWVKFEVHQHFKKQFAEDWVTRPVLEGVYKTIGLDYVSQHLISKFSEAEVLAAIKDCNSNKAPGPDGFNLLCYQKFWKVMKPKIMQFFADFHSNSKLTYGINSTFISLIPKVDNPTSLSEFRPISLPILSSIIGETQTAFIGGRNILDGVFIANEVVDGWKKSKKLGIILKLDFEKAFDSVNWKFLFSLLSNFGFGNKWISWIKTCITSVRISILVNGSPTTEFSPQRGLRQGDPLSPFLFNIVSEGLNMLLNRAINLGILRGVLVGSKDVLLSHLQFADDSIIFSEADWDQMVLIKRVLRCFEFLSGLRINYHKSVVCGVGMDDSLLLSFAKLLNCQVHSLPLKFLALPLGANPGRKSTWKPVLDKFRSKLSRWKRKLLSFAGRLTLIKSTLSSLPIYFLSLFKMPEGVAKEIERIQSTFLWGGNDLKRKVHLVKWGEATKSINQWGLGIRRLRDVNACLLLKWWWKFGTQINSLWRRALCSKYKIDEARWNPPNDFPLLFNLSTDKDGSLHQYLDRRTSPNTWNFPIRRTMFSWELEEEASLIEALSSAPSLSPHKADCFFWACATVNSGEFSVSSIYSFSNSTLGPHLPICNHIWNRAVPPKVSFFCWLAWKNKIKSAEFMLRIGILDPSASISCTFCGFESESATHVLLHCPFSWQIWSSIIQDWGLSWCIQDSVDGLLQWWMSVNFNHFDRLIWRAIPLIVLWSLWKCRNECIFEEAQPNISDLSETIKVRAALWLKASIKDLPFSVDDLTFNWRQIRAGNSNL